MITDVDVDVDITATTTNTTNKIVAVAVSWIYYIRLYLKFWLSLFDLLSSSYYLIFCTVVVFIISECGILVLMNRVLEVTSTMKTTTSPPSSSSTSSSSSSLTIPDMRIGYTPNDLIEYCGSIGENGREAYVNMMYFDLYPYMLGYSLTFGLLTYLLAAGNKKSWKYNTNHHHHHHHHFVLLRWSWEDLQLYVSGIFPTAMLFDIVESSIQLYCCKYYNDYYYYSYYDNNDNNNDNDDESMNNINYHMNHILLVLGCIGNLGKWILLIVGFTLWIPLLAVNCTR